MAVIIAAVTAVGFSQWRRDIAGRRKIELAEEVLALFYESKDINPQPT